jgi:hypothetical protein
MNRIHALKNIYNKSEKVKQIKFIKNNLKKVTSIMNPSSKFLVLTLLIQFEKFYEDRIRIKYVMVEGMEREDR